MNPDAIGTTVARYYAERLSEFGATPRGVDWRDEASQRRRFDELLAPWLDRAGSILDYGCGYGSLIHTLEAVGWDGSYTGFDLAGEMVAEARRLHADRPRTSFTDNRAALDPADVVVASGILNVRLDHDRPTWEAYVLETIDDLARLSRVGFSFNCLTAYADENHKREDLYYAEPAVLLDYCASRHSRWLRLTQDYGLYEFTLAVRLER